MLKSKIQHFILRKNAWCLIHPQNCQLGRTQNSEELNLLGPVPEMMYVLILCFKAIYLGSCTLSLLWLWINRVWIWKFMVPLCVMDGTNKGRPINRGPSWSLVLGHIQSMYAGLDDWRTAEVHQWFVCPNCSKGQIPSYMLVFQCHSGVAVGNWALCTACLNLLYQCNVLNILRTNRQNELLIFVVLGAIY